MATKLAHYGSGTVPEKIDIELFRGDGNLVDTFTHKLLAAEIDYVKVYVRVKDNTEPGTGTTIFTLDSRVETTQFDFGTNYQGNVFYTYANTASLRAVNGPAEYNYEATLTDGNPVTLRYGDWNIQYDLRDD